MAENDNYIEDYISYQGIYDSLASQGQSHHSDRYQPPPSRRSEDWDGDVDVAKGLISAKTVFYIVAFTAMATALFNPSLLIITLPLSTFVASMLALARRRKPRTPRRIGYAG